MRAFWTLSAALAWSLAPAPATPVDAFGQPRDGAWPGKVAAASELRADAEADRAYYDSFHPPARDRYGGLPDSGKAQGLSATGFFHVEQKGDRWLLADPDGNAFFHLGVCGVGAGDSYTVTQGRESDFAWLPQDGEFASAFLQGHPGVFSFHLANLERKFGEPYDPDAFSARMIGRLRKWGFNSVGAFSPLPPAVKAAGMPYVAHLPIDPGMGVAWIPGIANTWDPFEPANREKIDKAFAKSVAARADDPLLIGWFLVNEPLYEDIPKVVPGLKAGHACKRELVALLREKYGTIGAFDAAWGASAKSFDELGDATLAVTTRAASDDLHVFTGRFYEAYFRTVTEVYHKYDAHHLLLGNRLQPGTINDEQLCRIAGKYVDVMSFNYYTDAVDADLLRRIHAWTGRPLMLSEFYWTAPSESGLSGGRAVADQRERGLAYRNYVEQAAALGFVVGIEWFQLVDEAADGRWFEGKGGERANCGLLSVADRPWKHALAGIAEANYGIYGVWLDGQKPFAFDNARFAPAGGAKKTADVPRATGPVRVDGTTKNWPGIPPEIISAKRLVQGAAAGGLSATFKLCWDDANLYVLATVADPTPLRNIHTAAYLWMGDSIELFVSAESPGEGGPLRFGDRHLVVGTGAPGRALVHVAGLAEQPSCEAIVVPGGDGYTVEAAIPWAVLGLATPKPGLELLFDLGIDDSTDGHDRRAQLMWNGTDKNSADRTHWGGAKLLP